FDLQQFDQIAGHSVNQKQLSRGETGEPFHNGGCQQIGVRERGSSGKYGIMSYKKASGELVLDGVIFEGGKIAVMLDSMNGATIENCTFIDTEKAAISIGD